MLSDQTAAGESLIHMPDLDLLVGSGGVLSHAPRRAQSAAMLIDAFQPRGFTRLAVDSIFMMPHLGVLTSVNEQAAAEVFERDCLVDLGTCVAPAGQGKPGDVCATYEISLDDSTESGELKVGALHMFRAGPDREVEVSLHPESGWDAGAGTGQSIRRTVKGGVAGLILDGRGRPLPFSGGDAVERVAAWNRALDLYPRQ